MSRTQDWVVILFYDDHHQEGQHTVVTETRGAMAGRRVVRGREKACRGYYAEQCTLTHIEQHPVHKRKGSLL